MVRQLAVVSVLALALTACKKGEEPAPEARKAAEAGSAEAGKGAARSEPVGGQVAQAPQATGSKAAAAKTAKEEPVQVRPDPGEVPNGPDARAASYRTNVIDPRVRKVPEHIAQGLYNVPDAFIEPLVKFLVAQTDDPFLKVKILHDWIADNVRYDVESFLANRRLPDAGSVETVLRSRMSVCEGYSNVFNRMAKIAGFQSEKITGYGRGFGYLPSSVEEPGRSNHAWNAVKIENRWYLLDITWDAGSVKERNWEKRYSTAFLFLRAAQRPPAPRPPCPGTKRGCVGIVRSSGQRTGRAAPRRRPFAGG